MVTLTLLATGPARAGDTTHELDLRGGINEIVRADRMVAAIQHQGASPTFDLSWSPRAARAAHVVEVSFTPGQISPGPSWSFTRDGERLETGKDAAPLADLRYAVGRRVDAGDWTFHLGGTSANHFENITTNYGFYGMETYLGVLGLGPWLDLRRGLAERHGAELEAWAPLAAWIARNPYAGHSGQHIYNTRDNKPLLIIPRFLADGTPQTLNHYQSVHLRLGYTFALGETVALVARSRVDGLHLAVPHPLVEWQFGLDLGLRGRF